MARRRDEVPWLFYEGQNSVRIINAHTGTGIDSDAAAYIAAVEAADESPLSQKVKDAVHALFGGLKADGNWLAMKASCLLAGPSTLAGALVPVVGSAPVNNGFTPGDYSSLTGLAGDGATKYLATGRFNNSDPQNNFHAAVYATSVASFTLMGAATGQTGGVQLHTSAGTRCRAVTLTAYPSAFSSGFVGVSRSGPSSYTARSSQANQTIAVASQAPLAVPIVVFGTTTSSSAVTSFTSSRIAFYSTGEAVDLAALDARLATYMAAIQ